MIPPSDGNNRSDPQRPQESPLDGGIGGTLAPRQVLPHPLVTHVAPPALSAAPNAAALLKALRHRWLLALTVALLIAGPAATAVWFFLPPPKYTARTQLHVAAVPPALVHNRDEAQLNPEKYLQQQAYLIKDPFVLNAALNDPRNDPRVADLPTVKEQDDPLQWLEQEVKVESPSPEFLQVAISGDRPEDLKVLANAVTHAYLDNVVNKEQQDRFTRKEKLEEKRNELDTKLRNHRRDLKQLEKVLEPIALEHLPLQQLFAIQDLRNVQIELAQVHREMWRLESALGLRPKWGAGERRSCSVVLNAFPHAVSPLNLTVASLLGTPALFSPSAPAELDAAVVEQLLEQDTTCAELRQKIREQEMQIEQIRLNVNKKFFEKYAEKHLQKLALLKKNLQKRRDELLPRVMGGLRKRGVADAAGNQQQMKEKLAELRERDRLLTEKAEMFRKEVSQVNEQVVDLVNKKQDIAAEEMVIESIKKDIAVMEANEGMPPRVTLHSEAVLFTPDAAKRKVGFTTGTAVAALALVLLAFAWFEFHARKVRSAEEVVHGLGLRLVGTVPDLSQRAWLRWLRPGVDDPAYTQSLLTESVDAARTLVLHTARSERLQIIMITSALAGEGKTSLASHLAASLARAGRRTLLLDSDLRNPTLHRLFDMRRAPGLSEVLRGDADLSGVIRGTPISNLGLISAGQADGAALQALSLEGIGLIFEQLRKDYDFIVVDSCPVLPVADSLLVGQHVDAVIFSLLREVSRLPRVYAAYHRMALLDIRVLGAVVNGTQDEMYGANYHYISSES